jgi:aminopeptidase
MAQKLLRQGSPATTAVYLHPLLDDLEAAPEATEGEGWLRQMLATDDGASMLGEVALVAADNRLAQLGFTFFHVLFDENASSHIALGNSYTDTVPGSELLNSAERQAAGLSSSLVHYDFMIGGPEVDVFGVKRNGGEEAIMGKGGWQFPL